MDKIKEINLSDLRQKDAITPQRSFTNFVSPADELDPIINNTTIEDRVKGEGILQGDLATRIQRLEDKKNNFTLLNRQFASAENDLVKSEQGRGITAVGRRNTVVNNQRRLDAQRRNVAAEIEDLRGNIETAQSLRRQALQINVESTPSEAEKLKEDFINFLEVNGGTPEQIEQVKKDSADTFAKNLFSADKSLFNQDVQDFIDLRVKGIPLADGTQSTSGGLSDAAKISLGVGRASNNSGGGNSGLIPVGTPIQSNPSSSVGSDLEARRAQLEQGLASQ